MLGKDAAPIPIALQIKQHHDQRKRKSINPREDMKTVMLTSGKTAIPINVRFYMTEDRIIKTITDLVHQGSLDLTENKSTIIKEVKRHLRHQGLSVYGDWYEDTDETEPINRLYEIVEPFVKKMFPEYCI